MKQNTITPHDDAIKKFKEILVESGVAYEKVFLFGSRARGQYSEGSDWDFFIVVKDAVDVNSIRKARAQLRMRFHDYFPNSPIDIIIKDKTSFESEKFIINTISNEVFTEGMPA